MLNKDALKSKLKTGFQTYIVPALKEMELARHPNNSLMGKDMANKISEMFNETVSEQFADFIATCIDEYIKTASITGTIVTIGAPSTQQAWIFSMPMYEMNGEIPNTLGIS